LRNLSIMPANKQRLAQLDGVPALIQLLSSPHEEVQAQACMVLQNLSKSSDCRHMIVQQGGIPPLIALLWSFNEHVQEHSAGIVANLSVNPDNARKIVEEGGMPLLIGLLRSPCQGVQEQAAIAIRNLSVEPENEVCCCRHVCSRALSASRCESWRREAFLRCWLFCDTTTRPFSVRARSRCAI
jgi:hypothetical protein